MGCIVAPDIGVILRPECPKGYSGIEEEAAAANHMPVAYAGGNSGTFSLPSLVIPCLNRLRPTSRPQQPHVAFNEKNALYAQLFCPKIWESTKKRIFL